ncbi:hypothetical protein BDQ12DRAFT_718194 [Crucibulum laeve]|uniref:Fungal-type protein kinase domain-containing protein n=1 Tax=Crucibulum laeve TaxID=68775 RepID=A0A5C3ML87_9AGAR|nr:hypothetical protein BDQ12DRAFT_718194 [Crucibulum laeve]
MWNKNQQSGLLNDFDLAVLQDINIGKHITANHGKRTGTLPFMALGLLTKKYYNGRIECQYHHELESFIWVLTWLCLYDAGDNVKEKLAKWKTRYYDHLLARKLYFIQDSMDIMPKSGFEKLWDINHELLLWVGRQNTPSYWTRHKETIKKSEYLYKDMEDIMEKAEREYNFNLDNVD